MPVDWSQLFQTGVNAAANLLPRSVPRLLGPPTRVPSVNLPQLLAGGGLLGYGAMADKEPGQVTEARQFLRNRFTSPTALTDQFTGQLGALHDQFQPLLDQQRQRDIGDISQRFAAAFPSTVGAQGPEFGTLGRYLTEQALPHEQSLLGELGLKLLDYQGNAAGKILETSKPDPLSQLSTILGYDALTRGVGNDGAQLLSPTGQRLGTVGANGQLLTNRGGAGIDWSNIGAQILQSGGVASPLAQQIGRLLGGTLGIDMAMAGPGISGVTITTSQGVQIPIEAIASLGTPGGAPGAVAQLTGTGGAVGAGGAAGFQGLLGPSVTGSTTASGVLAGLGSGVAGTAIGTAIANAFEQANAGKTSNLETGVVGGVSGAASGAAVGAAMFDGPGAVIGAIVGGLGGGIFGSFAERRREDAQQAQEAAATAGDRPAAMAYLDETLNRVKQAEQTFRAIPNLINIGTDEINALVQSDPSFAEVYRANRAILNKSLDNWNDQSPFGVNQFLNDLTGKRSSLSNPNPNGEGPRDLLQSPEVGRFYPGWEMVKRERAKIDAAVTAFSNIVAELAKRGAI